MGLKKCTSCQQEISDKSKWVVSNNSGNEIYYHVFCFYPNLVMNFRRVTRSYITRSIEDLQIQKIKFDLVEKLFSEIDIIEEFYEMEEDDELEEEYTDFVDDLSENEIDEIENNDFPSAA